MISNSSPNPATSSNRGFRLAQKKPESPVQISLSRRLLWPSDIANYEQELNAIQLSDYVLSPGKTSCSFPPF